MRLILLSLLFVAVAGCRVMVKEPDRTTNNDWEYRTLVIGRPSGTEINRYATNGWEILSFSINPKLRQEDADNWTLLLRRSK